MTNFVVEYWIFYDDGFCGDGVLELIMVAIFLVIEH